MSFFRAVSVKISFGNWFGTPTWNDVSRYVRAGPGIQIQRGRGDQFTQINPGEMSLILNNRDGRFTVGNTGSPYYPNVKIGKKIWVQAIFTTKNWVDPDSSSFENDTGDWLAGGTNAPTITKDGTRSFDGGYSLRTVWQTGGSFPLINLTLYGLSIGKQYAVSGYAYVPTGSPGLTWVAGGIGFLGSTMNTKDAWTRVTGTFTATDTKADLQLWPSTSPTAGQQFWLDAVQVEYGSSPTAYDPTGALRSDRFVGWISEWPLTWVDGITQNPQVSIKAQDRLRKFAQAAEFAPFLVEEEKLSGAMCIYPMSETDAISTPTLSAGDRSGDNRASLQAVHAGGLGTLTFGTGVGPGTDGFAAPTFARSSGTVGWYLRAPFDATDASTTKTLECWFNTGALGGVSASLCELGPMSLSLDSTGHLNGYSNGTFVAASTTSVDSHTHHAVVTDDGVTVTLYLDGASVATGASLTPAAPLGSSGYVYVGWGSGQLNGPRMYNGVISHVCAYPTALDVTAVGRHYTAGTTGFANDTSDQRIGRFLDYLGVTTAERNIETGLTVSLVTQQLDGQQPLTAMQDVTKTESGVLFIDRSGVVQFQSRGHRYNQTSTFSVNAEDLAAAVQFSVDDSLLAVVGNDVTGSRPGGATQRVVNQDSITAYGRYAQSLNLLCSSDDEVFDRLSWDTNRYGDPGPRSPGITYDLLTIGLAFTGGTGGGYSDTYTDSFDAANLPVIPAVDVDIGDRITVQNMPATAPSAVFDLSVEGTTEDIGIDRHRITLNCSDFADNNAWILDDPVYSVLDYTTRLVY